MTHHASQLNFQELVVNSQSESENDVKWHCDVNDVKVVCESGLKATLQKWRILSQF